MVTRLLTTVVENDVERAGDGDDELVEVFVGVAAALGAAGYVVEVVGAFDVEGNMTSALHEGEVTTCIGDFWQIDNVAGMEIELAHSGWRLMIHKSHFNPPASLTSFGRYL